MLAAMTLEEQRERIGTLAGRHGAPDEQLVAVLVADPSPGERVFLCAFVDREGRRTWLVLDAQGRPVRDRNRVREAVSIAALCELAEESSGIGGPSRVASPEYLDELGSASAEIAAAVQQGFGAVQELSREVEARYKVPLDGS
jgi:hypothetical protein